MKTWILIVEKLGQEISRRAFAHRKDVEVALRMLSAREFHRARIIDEVTGSVARERARCQNCGAETNFGNAIGEREKLGWCGGCFEQFVRNSLLDDKGNRVWRERTLYDRTPYDARAPRDDSGA